MKDTAARITIIIYLLLAQFGPWLRFGNFRPMRVDHLLLPLIAFICFYFIKNRVFKEAFFYLLFIIHCVLVTFYYSNNSFFPTFIATLNNLAAISTPYFLVWFFSGISFNKSRFHLVIKTLLLTSILVNVYGILQIYSIPEIRKLDSFLTAAGSTFATDPVRSQLSSGRITSVFINAGGPYGLYCAWILLLVFTSRRRYFSVPVLLLISGLDIVAGFMAKSHTFTGVLIYVLFVFLYQFNRQKYYNHKSAMFVLNGAAVIFLVWLFIFQLSGKNLSNYENARFTIFTNIKNTSKALGDSKYVSSRTFEMFAAYFWVEFKNSPIFGKGLTLYIYDGLYGPLVALGGIVGIIFLIVTGITFFKYFKKYGSIDEFTTLAARRSLILFFLGGLSTPSFFVARLSNLFFVFIGAYIGLYTFHQSEKKLNRIKRTVIVDKDTLWQKY